MRPAAAALGEVELYAPVKRFLEARGYEVKGEVCGCDLVARHIDDRGDEPPVIVELKLRFQLFGRAAPVPGEHYAPQTLPP